MQESKTLVHVAHSKALRKTSVANYLKGLFTSRSYQREVGRSVVVLPMEGKYVAGGVHELLGEGSQVLYSALDGIKDHAYAGSLATVERKFGATVIYGVHSYQHEQQDVSATVEVVLIDISKVNIHPVNVLKAWMYEEFTLASDRFEHMESYDRAVKLGPVSLGVLRAIDASDPSNPTVIVSHNAVSIPTALAAVLEPLGSFKTVFCAHEVAPVRAIVEGHAGHDTQFANAMEWARSNNYYLGDFFGPQDESFEYALIRASRFCDKVIAISDRVRDELKFLGPNLDLLDVDVTYKGLFVQPLSLDEKMASRRRLQQYTENLLGFKPDFIFTHAARMCTSKAFWRDLRVLYQIEDYFVNDGRTGVFFLVSTEPAEISLEPKNSNGMLNWPVAHRENNGDLSEDESNVYALIQEFNARNRNVKAVLVNQSAWEDHREDARMPDGMSLMDFRWGGDLEMNQSIYEPFGATPLESLAYGGVSLLSGVAGSMQLLEKKDAFVLENLVVADYTEIDTAELNKDSIKSIDQFFRNQIEDRISARLARIVQQRLPRDEAQVGKYLEQGYELAKQLNWDIICEQYFLPAIKSAYHKKRMLQIA